MTDLADFDLIVDGEMRSIRTVAILDKTIPLSRVARYCEYLTAEKEAVQNMYKFMLEASSNEITMDILGYLARMVYPDPVPLEQASHIGRFDTRSRTPRLDKMVIDLHLWLCDKREALYELTRKAMVQTLTFTTEARFPTKASPKLLPYDQPQHSLAQELYHLEINISLNDERQDQYPTKLFAAQDHIHKLKMWYPSLQSVCVVVIWTADDPQRPLKARMAREADRAAQRSPFTNLAKEAVKLVNEMKKLSLRRRFLMYRTRYSVDELVVMSRGEVEQSLFKEKVKWLDACGCEAVEEALWNEGTEVAV